MYFFFYAFLIAALFIFSGIGLTILITPSIFEKYSLYFSPFVGLAYLSYCSWFLFEYSSMGTNHYAKFLLIPPLFFLVLAIILKKDRIISIGFPFNKENLILILICGILFLSIAYPYYSRTEGISNTISWGNNDIVDYASTSKYLMTSSFTHPAIQSPIVNPSTSFSGNTPEPHLRFPWVLHKYYFSAYLSTAIPSSIFALESYQIQNLVIYLFYIFIIPLIFLISVEIFSYSKNMALFVALLIGLNFNLLYLVYDGFLGQIIGMGFFFCLFLIMYYPLITHEKFSNMYPYLPLSVLFFYGLCMSYEPLIPFIFISLFIFLFMYSLKNHSKTNIFHSVSYILLTILLTVLISPLAIIHRMEEVFLISKISGGLELPVLYPDGIFGMNVYSLLSQSTPAIITGALSVAIAIVVIFSFYRMYKDNYQLFCLAFSSVAFVIVVYGYYTVLEALSPSFSGDGYKAYKIMTYFIPILSISALYFFKDLHLSNITRGYNAKKIFFCGVFFLLLVGNLCSACVMISTSTQQSKRISEDIIGLKRIDSLDNVASINIEENAHWTQMWMYYFLMGNKPLYLKYSTYWDATLLKGEWTLKPNSDVIRVTIRNDPFIINDGFYLEKNVIFNATYGEGWYYPESNNTLQWRWTGAYNESSSIILYLTQPQLIDLDLTYWSLNPANELTVILDNNTHQVCNGRNQCRIPAINLTSGSHILTLKTKLPPQPAGKRDARSLGYAFSNITFSPSSKKPGDTS
jgi:hypothetical protein